MGFVSTFISHKKPLKYLVSRLMMKLGICRYFYITRNGYRIRFHPVGIPAQLWIEPNRMRWEEQILEQVLKEGDVFIDIGANVGTLTCRAAELVGSSGKVFSFEADPTLAKCLLDNVRLNIFNNVDVHSCAVGEKNSTISFLQNKSDDRGRVAESGNVNIPLKKLDDVIPSDLDITMVKIDVEGYENMVLKGAKNVLSKANFVLMEYSVSNAALYNYDTRENLAALTSLGFSIFKVGKNNIIYSINKTYMTQETLDILAVRDVTNLMNRTTYRLPTS